VINTHWYSDDYDEEIEREAMFTKEQAREGVENLLSALRDNIVVTPTEFTATLVFLDATFKGRSDSTERAMLGLAWEAWREYDRLEGLSRDQKLSVEMALKLVEMRKLVKVERKS